MLKGKTWNMFRSKLLSLLLVLTMAAGLFGALGADAAYASTTTFLLKVNGTTVDSAVDPTNYSQDVYNYSTYKGGAPNYYTGYGPTLSSILSSKGVTVSSITSVTAKASDNFSVTFSSPQQDLFGTPNTLYYFDPNGGQQAVPTIIATAAMGGHDQTTLDQLNTLRLFMGQQTSTEANNSWMVKWVNEIDVTTT